MKWDCEAAKCEMRFHIEILLTIDYYNVQVVNESNMKLDFKVVKE